MTQNNVFYLYAESQKRKSNNENNIFPLSVAKFYLENTI